MSVSENSELFHMEKFGAFVGAPQTPNVSIWNKSADSRRVCFQIRDALRQTLNLPIDATMEYKKHTDSMRDNSSYRNANANFGEHGKGQQGQQRSTAEAP